MENVNFENPLILAIGGAFLSSIAFLILDFKLPEEAYLRGFFFNFLPIQFLNTWLFSLSLLFVLARSRNFMDEAEVVQRIRIVNLKLSYSEAETLLKKLPTELSHTLIYRRIREVLTGYLNREDVIRLNEELSRRDISQVERGHLLLSSMRNIIPVVGFLGTVIGLSHGMAKFPEISAKVGNMVDLKEILKGFASDLSVAFDTTLLALAYTIVVILVASFLRGKEERHVDYIDDRVRGLISNFERTQQSAESRDTDKLDYIARLFQKQFQSVMTNFQTEWNERFSSKMDELIAQVKK